MSESERPEGGRPAAWGRGTRRTRDQASTQEGQQVKPRHHWRLLDLWLPLLLAILVAAGASALPFGHHAASAPPAAKVAAVSKAVTTDHLTTAPLATTGCGLTPPTAPGTTVPQDLIVGKTTRHYVLHVPLGYDGRDPVALLLAFHGHGSTAERFPQYTGFNHLADTQNVIVAYPQGAIGPDLHTGWNTGRLIDPKTNDLLFTSTLMTHLQHRLCIDPQRIYATGFSNGGGFTALLACHFADRIAAFGIVSGDYPELPGSCSPSHPASILEIHGTGDHINPYQGRPKSLLLPPYYTVPQWLAQWTKRDGCDTTPVVFLHSGAVTGEQYPRCADGAALVHYEIAGGVHTWPSSGWRSHGKPGPDSQLDATSVIWSFFAQHTLPYVPVNAPDTSGTPTA